MSEPSPEEMEAASKLARERIEEMTLQRRKHLESPLVNHLIKASRCDKLDVVYTEKLIAAYKDLVTEVAATIDLKEEDELTLRSTPGESAIAALYLNGEQIGLFCRTVEQTPTQGLKITFGYIRKEDESRAIQEASSEDVQAGSGPGGSSEAAGEARKEE